MCYNINRMALCSKCKQNSRRRTSGWCKTCYTTYYKDLRISRSRRGMCVSCGSNKRHKNKLRCSSCLHKQSANTRAYRHRLKKERLLCVSCYRHRQTASSNVCQPCFTKQEFLPWLKTSVGCKDCGEHFKNNPEVLEFDHIPTKGAKIANVSSLINSLSRMIKEIRKCDVVCANCHSIRTTNRKKKDV